MLRLFTGLTAFYTAINRFCRPSRILRSRNEKIRRSENANPREKDRNSAPNRAVLHNSALPRSERNSQTKFHDRGIPEGLTLIWITDIIPIQAG